MVISEIRKKLGFIANKNISYWIFVVFLIDFAIQKESNFSCILRVVISSVLYFSCILRVLMSSLCQLKSYDVHFTISIVFKWVTFLS